MTRSAPRILVAFATIDVAFKTLVVPAYIAAAGGPMSDMLPAVAAVAGVAVALFLAVAAVIARAVDRTLDDESDAGVRRSLARLHGLPLVIALAWTIEWFGFVSASSVVTGSWSHAQVPVILFALTMIPAPLALGYLMTMYATSPVLTRIAHVARGRKIALEAPPLSLRAQLVMLAVCMVLSPTLYLSSFAFAARQELMPLDEMWMLVVVFIAGATLYAVLSAAFFASAMSGPLVQMTRIVQTIAQVGDVSNVARLPEIRRDEIGELARWTNVMIDRLEEVEAERSALTRTLEDRVDERTRHLHKAELELRQAQKLEAVGRLAAGIAHEINTPIQFVSNNVEFAQRSLLDLLELVEHHRATLAAAAPDAVAETARKEDAIDLEYLQGNLPTALDQAVMGLRRVTTIVASMRRFAREDHDGMVLVDINEALESTLVVTRHEYKDVAELDTSFQALPYVMCYPGQLNQAFLNIIVNAAHAISDVVSASGSRGRLGVRTHLDGDAVQIAISDSGGGIPEAVRERIFDPFFTTKEVGRGTGQGLAIARSVLLDLHDGDLRFETETGKGTTFFIRLPVDGGQRAMVRT